ncbi:jg1227 [Pararge aegeria aegeria]|uniref:Jg1227 protein n=1 Tax=Pararge aegeria aegeria TaxID=348720 RepID=A0A8S4QM21_9NEOP|nr:jg1227 [Pararge aegeria aegeria]
MDVGVTRCWNGSPVLVSAALVDPQRGGQTTLSASQVAVGSKRLRIVELGTPYKRSMSSSGRLSVDVMMMMMIALTANDNILRKSACQRDGIKRGVKTTYLPLASVVDYGLNPSHSEKRPVPYSGPVKD